MMGAAADPAAVPATGAAARPAAVPATGGAARPAAVPATGAATRPTTVPATGPTTGPTTGPATGAPSVVPKPSANALNASVPAAMSKLPSGKTCESCALLCQCADAATP